MFLTDETLQSVIGAAPPLAAMVHNSNVVASGHRGAAVKYKRAPIIETPALLVSLELKRWRRRHAKEVLALRSVGLPDESLHLQK